MALFKGMSKDTTNPASYHGSLAMPVITIQLSTPPGHFYHPNEMINGQVTISTPMSIAPTALEASLWGHSNVWLRESSSNSTTNSTSYRHYRDNAPLFKEFLNLIPYGTKLDPGRLHTFPFQFRMPERTNELRRGCYKDDGDASWTVQPHNLPPSFLSGSSADHPDCASISYGVTARLVCPGIGTGKNGLDPVSGTAALLFYPFSTAPSDLLTRTSLKYWESTYSPLHTLTSSSLLSPSAPKPSMRQKLSARLSSTTPSISFRIHLSLPMIVFAGGEFPIAATFLLENRSENASYIPPVTVHVQRLELASYTHLRAPRDRKANTMMSGNHFDGTDRDEPNGAYEGQWERTRTKKEKGGLNALPERRLVDVNVDAEKGRSDCHGDAGLPWKGEDEKAKVRDVERGSSTNDIEAGRSTTLLPSYTEANASLAPTSTASTLFTPPVTATSSRFVKTVMFTSRIPSTTEPAFVSFGISRMYKIKAKVSVEIAGKRFDIEGESTIRDLGTAI